MILTVKGIHVESYEDEEVLIEYTLANPIPFKDVVDCFVNNKKVHLTKEGLQLSNTKSKEYLTLSNTEIENWFTQKKTNG